MPVRAALLTTVHLAALAIAPARAAPELIVLGIAQDAGVPQLGCTEDCCAAALEDPRLAQDASCVAIVDREAGRRWLLDAPLGLPRQLGRLDALTGRSDVPIDGIFITHAHVGHYTGLMHLGREAMGAQGVPVYAMPRLGTFLEQNGPWSQLIELGNIELRELHDGQAVILGGDLTVVPLLVPHRDEFSETVGFIVRGPMRSALYLPDIDKWALWERGLIDVLHQVDRAYVDGSFFDGDELPGRDMSEIPHPFMVETLAEIANLALPQREKVRFIHLNHTNPAWNPRGAARGLIEAAGCAVAAVGERFEL